VVAKRLLELREATKGEQRAALTRRERPPGIAEYLDAVRAYRELEVDAEAQSRARDAIEEFTLRKPTEAN